jgi:hypothetical protein
MCQSNWGREYPSLSYDKETKNIINDLYRPLIIEHDIPLEKNEILLKYKNYETTAEMTPYNLYSYYKSMYLCADSYTEYNKHDKFDYYIKTRYDGVLTNFPDLNNLNCVKNTIIVPDYHPKITNAIANNTFICKDEDIFLSCMRIHNFFDILCNKTIINDEQFFYEYCTLCNIEIKKLALNIFHCQLPQEFDFDMS